VKISREYRSSSISFKGGMEETVATLGGWLPSTNLSTSMVTIVLFFGLLIMYCTHPSGSAATPFDLNSRSSSSSSSGGHTTCTVTIMPQMQNKPTNQPNTQNKTKKQRTYHKQTNKQTKRDLSVLKNCKHGKSV
jgi:hypothetical protein